MNTKNLADLLPELQSELAAFNKPRTHKRTAKRPMYARFKLGFKYRDGNSSYHYSYDYLDRHEAGHKWKVRDERQGFAFLLKLVQKNMREDTFISAFIYCTLTDTDTSKRHYNYQVAKFVRGMSPFYAPIRMIEMRQEEEERKPLPARIETVLDVDQARKYFAFK